MYKFSCSFVSWNSLDVCCFPRNKENSPCRNLETPFRSQVGSKNKLSISISSFHSNNTLVLKESYICSLTPQAFIIDRVLCDEHLPTQKLFMQMWYSKFVKWHVESRKIFCIISLHIKVSLVFALNFTLFRHSHEPRERWINIMDYDKPRALSFWMEKPRTRRACPFYTELRQKNVKPTKF